MVMIDSDVRRGKDSAEGKDKGTESSHLKPSGRREKVAVTGDNESRAGL